MIKELFNRKLRTRELGRPEPRIGKSILPYKNQRHNSDERWRAFGYYNAKSTLPTGYTLAPNMHSTITVHVFKAPTYRTVSVKLSKTLPMTVWAAVRKTSLSQMQNLSCRRQPYRRKFPYRLHSRCQLHVSEIWDLVGWNKRHGKQEPMDIQCRKHSEQCCWRWTRTRYQLCICICTTCMERVFVNGLDCT